MSCVLETLLPEGRMMDPQKMFDLMSAGERRVRSCYHLTLGELLEALKDVSDDLPVRLDCSEKGPGKAMSYRGYYNDLAFMPFKGITVGELRKEAEYALDNTFGGYKGGDYTMDADTPLWISAYGLVSGLAVIDIEATPESVVLRTKQTK